MAVGINVQSFEVKDVPSGKDDLLTKPCNTGYDGVFPLPTQYGIEDDRKVRLELVSPSDPPYATILLSTFSYHLEGEGRWLSS